MRRLAILLTLVVLTSNALAQPSLAPLSNYVGRYEYESTTGIDMISGKDLFAVLDEAKYKLPRTGADTFANGAGQPIAFHRDVTGNVDGFEEHGHFYRRLSSTPSVAARNLSQPRPNGDQSYSYQIPTDRHDGIATGDIAQSDLGADVAAKIAKGILDETWERRS